MKKPTPHKNRTPTATPMLKLKRNSFLFLDTRSKPLATAVSNITTITAHAVTGERDRNPCISSRGKDLYTTILKKYQRLTGAPHPHLYFLQFPKLDPPLTIKNVFSYLPIIHLHPQIQVSFAPLHPSSPSVLPSPSSRWSRLVTMVSGVSSPIFKFEAPFHYHGYENKLQVQVTGAGGGALRANKRLRREAYSHVFSGESRLIKDDHYHHNPLLRVLRAFVVKNSFLNSSPGFITGIHDYEREKQFRQIYREPKEKEEQKQTRLSIHHLNVDTIAAKFITHFSAILYNTSRLLERSTDFITRTYKHEHKKQLQQAHRESTAKERQIFSHRYENQFREVSRKVTEKENEFDTFAAKFTTHFSSVLHTTSRLLESSTDFVTRTYRHEHEKAGMLHAARSPIEFVHDTCKTPTGKTLFFLAHFAEYYQKVIQKENEFDTIAAKFTTHFSSVLHTASRLLESSTDFVTRTYIYEHEKQLQQVQRESTAKERQILSHRAGGARSPIEFVHDTCKTPTGKTLFSLAHFAEYYQKVIQKEKEFDTIAAKFTTHFSSVLHTTSRLLESSTDFVTRTYIYEHEKQLQQVNRESTAKDRQILSHRYTKQFREVFLKVTEKEKEFDTIAAKFTTHFSSVLHTASRLLESSTDFVTRTYKHEHEKAGMLHAAPSPIGFVHDTCKTPTGKTLFSLAHFAEFYQTVIQKENEFDTIAAKFTTHFSSVLHTTSRLLESSTDFVTRTYKHEYEKRVQQVPWIHRQAMPPAAKNPFEKGFLDLPKLFIKGCLGPVYFASIRPYYRIVNAFAVKKIGGEFRVHRESTAKERQIFSHRYTKQFREVSRKVTEKENEFHAAASKFTNHFSSFAHLVPQLLRNASKSTVGIDELQSSPLSTFLVRYSLYDIQKLLLSQRGKILAIGNRLSPGTRQRPPKSEIFRQVWGPISEISGQAQGPAPTSLYSTGISHPAFSVSFTPFTISTDLTPITYSSPLTFLTHTAHSPHSVYSTQASKLSITSLPSIFLTHSTYSHHSPYSPHSTYSTYSTKKLSKVRRVSQTYMPYPGVCPRINEGSYSRENPTAWRNICRAKTADDLSNDVSPQWTFLTPHRQVSPNPPAKAFDKVLEKLLIKSFLGVQGAIFQKSPLAAGGKKIELSDILLAYPTYSSSSTALPPGITSLPSIFLTHSPHSLLSPHSPYSPHSTYSTKKLSKVSRVNKTYTPYSISFVPLTPLDVLTPSTFLTYSPHSPYSPYSPYSPTSDYRYWTERKWQQFFISRYTGISSSMSNIKMDIFKYIAADTDDVFTIVKQEAEKRAVEEQSFRFKIESESKTGDQNKQVTPELPGFDKNVMESRYTSGFFLNKHQAVESGPGPGTAGPMTINNVNISLPAEKWMSLGPEAFEEEELSPVEKLWQQAGAYEASTSFPGSPRTLELGSSLFGDSGKYPTMSYFSPETAGLYEETVKKIEKKIVSETQRFKAGIDRTISSSPLSMPDINLPQLADNVYALIAKRVKKERKMRGY